MATVINQIENSELTITSWPVTASLGLALAASYVVVYILVGFLIEAARMSNAVPMTVFLPIMAVVIGFSVQEIPALLKLFDDFQKLCDENFKAPLAERVRRAVDSARREVDRVIVFRGITVLFQVIAIIFLYSSVSPKSAYWTCVLALSAAATAMVLSVRLKLIHTHFRESERAYRLHIQSEKERAALLSHG